MIISIVSFLMFVSSIMVITSFSPVTSVVYLIATFVITAIYLSSQSMVYIALTYIIVYVGAVITLFLFVIMMINLGAGLSSTPFTQTIPLTTVMVVIYTVLVVSSHSPSSEQGAVNSVFLVITKLATSQADGVSVQDSAGSLTTSLAGSTAVPALNHWNQIQSIGFELYTHQALWLVLVSIVLMISMIGPIVICRNENLIKINPQIKLQGLMHFTHGVKSNSGNETFSNSLINSLQGLKCL